MVAYVLTGNGYFDEGRDPFSYDYAGSGWLDLERACSFGPETTVLYERDGEGIRVTAGLKGVRSCFSAAVLGGADCLAGADRDEHPRRAAHRPSRNFTMGLSSSTLSCLIAMST